MLDVTEQIRSATVATAESAGRPLLFVSRPSVSKEDLAREIARRDGIEQGLICVLSAVEVLWSYDIRRNRKTRMLDLVPADDACVHERAGVAGEADGSGGGWLRPPRQLLHADR